LHRAEGAFVFANYTSKKNAPRGGIVLIKKYLGTTYRRCAISTSLVGIPDKAGGD
jgi:hypothetical protein